MDAAIIEAAQMSPGDSQINAANLDICHLFGFDDGVANVFGSDRWVSDLAFPNSARTSLAQTDDVEHAGRVYFANDGADFGSADFQADNDRRWIKHFFSYI